MLQIRKIRPDDIGFVMEFASERIGSGSKLLANIENFLICESDNVKCGCGCLVLSKDRGFIGWVIVSEDYRRQKLGGAITKALLNIADLKGIKEVYASGMCESFLKAMGFEGTNNKDAMDELKEVFGDTGDSNCYKVSLEGYFRTCTHK